MQSRARSVTEYLAELPPERAKAIERVRRVILDNLDAGYEEGMSYGMIGYCVSRRVFPDGYHCDPRQALPFAALASQKNYMSLYLMGLYCGVVPGREDNPLHRWFVNAWQRSGKKLDMGKACIRFKSVDDLPLDVVGESIRRLPAAEYVKRYVASRAAAAAKKSGARTSKTAQGKAPSKKAGSTKPAAQKQRSRKV